MESFLVVLKEVSITTIKRKNRGQSLVEVLASIVIILLVITAIVMGTTYTVRQSTFSKNQTLATKYAQEGMERVRSFRDQDPETFFTKGDIEETETIDDVFLRKISFKKIEENKKIQVTVVVSWEDQTGKHEAKQTSIFTRW